MSERKKFNITWLFLIPVVMFGFGYLMVPIYDIFCDITGLNGKTGSLSQAQASHLDADEGRWVKVEFISALNQDMAMEFQPEVTHMLVNPGKTYSTGYIATNKKRIPVVGQAVPSLAPAQASTYFKKTECFCFTQQAFAAGETKHMPLIFVVSPDLPDDIETVTLSYTFFDVNNRDYQASL